MAQYRTELLALKIAPSHCDLLATWLFQEFVQLPSELKSAIRANEIVPIQERLDELVAFQSFVDDIRLMDISPGFVRAHVITQNYICFVYLGEALFQKLRKPSPPSSTLRKCSEFLTDNPVRAFRNAIAHANWQYKSDFTGLVYWSRKGDDKDAPLTQWEVSQQTLSFWQGLARTVGYVVYSALAE